MKAQSDGCRHSIKLQWGFWLFLDSGVACRKVPRGIDLTYALSSTRPTNTASAPFDVDAVAAEVQSAGNHRETPGRHTSVCWASRGRTNVSGEPLSAGVLLRVFIIGQLVDVVRILTGTVRSVILARHYFLIQWKRTEVLVITRHSALSCS